MVKTPGDDEERTAVEWNPAAGFDRLRKVIGGAKWVLTPDAIAQIAYYKAVVDTTRIFKSIEVPQGAMEAMEENLCGFLDAQGERLQAAEAERRHAKEFDLVGGFQQYLEAAGIAEIDPESVQYTERRRAFAAGVASMYVWLQTLSQDGDIEDRDFSDRMEATGVGLLAFWGGETNETGD